MAGYKNQLNKSLDTAYGEAYDATMTALNENLSALGSGLASQIEKDEEKLREQAEFMTAREQDLLVLAYQLYGASNPDLFVPTQTDSGDISDVQWSDTGLDLLYDVDDEGTRTLSDVGKNIMAQIMYGTNGSQFNNYIMQNYDAETYDAWINGGYANAFQEALTGSATGEGYDPTVDYLTEAANEYHVNALEESTNLGDVTYDDVAYQVKDLYDDYHGNIFINQAYKNFTEEDLNKLKLSNKEIKKLWLNDVKLNGVSAAFGVLSKENSRALQKAKNMGNEALTRLNALDASGKVKVGDVVTINGKSFVKTSKGWANQNDVAKKNRNKNGTNTLDVHGIK